VLNNKLLDLDYTSILQSNARTEHLNVMGCYVVTTSKLLFICWLHLFNIAITTLNVMCCHIKCEENKNYNVGESLYKCLHRHEPPVKSEFE
jgi:hypothetical protein